MTTILILRRLVADPSLAVVGIMLPTDLNALSSPLNG